MKNYFSAILVGSLFSCSVLSIGIVDEPEKLRDYSDHSVDVQYNSFDKKHSHYLVVLAWSDQDGEKWEQWGRLAKKKDYFYFEHRRSLERFTADGGSSFYFFPEARARKRGRRLPVGIRVPKKKAAVRATKNTKRKIEEFDVSVSDGILLFKKRDTRDRQFQESQETSDDDTIEF